jgi:hypothetical protein
MRRRFLLATVVALVLVSCGGDGSTTTIADGGETTVPDSEPAVTSTISVATSAPETGTDDPCGLVSADVVASIFGSTAASGEPGIARNCHFEIQDGVSRSVEVFHYGSSDQWDGIREGYEDNRGGVTEVPGLGDSAYQPNDVGPYEIVVRSGDTIFAVAVQEGRGGDDVEAAIFELATAIAGG